MVLRVPTKKSSVGTFACFTNPANPTDPIPIFDSFALFAKADNPKKKALAFQSYRVNFSAKNHGKVAWEKADRKLERYFVFALKDGEAVLLNKGDAESAFALTSQIPEAAAEEGEASFAPPQINEFATTRERNAHLEENFGSRKRKKNQEKMKMAAVSADKVVGAAKLETALEDLLADDGKDETGPSKVTGNLRRLLPPFDERAESLEDVYPLAGLFPPQDRNAVINTVEPEDFLFDSSYAKARYTSTKSKETKALAGYVECLVRFNSRLRDFVASPKDVVRITSFGDEHLAESLLTRFLEPQPENLGGGFGKTRLLKDKLLINLLLVILVMENYKLRPEVLAAIATDLKTDVGSLTPLLFKAGCKTSTDGDKKVYALITPLIFPEERRRGAKRRKA